MSTARACAAPFAPTMRPARVHRRVRARASASEDDARVICVVGGTGRIGAMVVERLLTQPTRPTRVRVLARDDRSARAERLKALGAEVTRGDVVSEADVEAWVSSARCDACVAAFGAQRIGKITDVFAAAPETLEDDFGHPYWVNFRAVRTLAEVCERSGCEKFIRVTGMSVGYPAFDWIAVLLNVVLSMTIQWQLAGERALRAICAASSTMKYVVVRPGSLSDAAPCAEDVAGQRRLVLGCGDARVHAGKVARTDVADVIIEALNRADVQNATLSVAGSATPSGGVRTELVWDPARGMHWKTVEQDDNVREGVDYKDSAMWTAVTSDVSELREKNHRRYVAMFLALLVGLGVLFIRAFVGVMTKVFL
jgi:nucleoside-diphosphate-sugar epimerase